MLQSSMASSCKVVFAVPFDGFIETGKTEILVYWVSSIAYKEYRRIPKKDYKDHVFKWKWYIIKSQNDRIIES